MPRPRSGEGRQDFLDRCMGDPEARRTAPSSEQRYAFCNSLYEQAHNSSFVILRAATAAPSRVTTFMGRPFRVVPAVLVRSQILQNNLGRTFLPADEISADWAEAWNGIPVLVGPHPSHAGQPMSGRTPELLNARGAGWIFSARAEMGPDNVRRLTGEVWLDVERAAVVPGLSDVLAAVDAGHPVELSTGFSTHPEEQAGNFQGESYDWVLHPMGADHLVISTEMTGACSVRDGCGLGVNCKCGGTCMSDAIQAATTTETVPEVVPAAEGEVQNETASVDGTPHPRGDFAYAPAGVPPSQWALPIFDAAHARAALARFNQTQIPAEARAGAWRKIMRACDKFNIDVADRTMPSMNTGSAGLKGIFAKIAELFAPARPTMMTYEDMLAANTVRQMAASALTPSDQERAQMLKEALQEAYGDNAREVCVCDVYSEPEKYVIFWFATPMGPTPKGMEYLRAEWTDADNDGIPEIVKGEPVLVRKQTSYEPVGTGPAGDGVPAGNTEVEVPQPVGGEKQVDNHEEERTMAGNEENKDVMAAITALGEQISAINAKVTALEASDATVAGLKRTITALSEQVTKVQQTAAPAVEERERKRVSLVQELAGNHRVPFTLAELEGKPLDELEKIKAMASTENFAGRGGPQGSELPKRFVEPVAYWLVDQKDKK